jgi:peptidylprolyl isomerase
MPTRLLALLGILAAFAFAACGDDEDEGGGEAAQTQTETAPAETEPTETETTEDSGDGGDDVRVSPTKNLERKPRIPRQPGDPPSELVVDDIVEGDGQTARAGDVVTMRYVGVRFRDNQQFDASWDREPNEFEFPLGGGQVIQGWDQGIVGMKVGGRRQLTIPPDLAYGAQGAPPDIAPNETLIFVVDLKGVERR